MKNIIIFAFVILGLISCDNSDVEKTTKIENVSTNDYSELDTKARSLFGTITESPENENNTITTEKVTLGKKLYFETRLSKDNTQSCNTCHNVETYGVDNKSFSEGNDGKLGGRNSPTTFNAAFHLSQFWDGREPDVEGQAGGPILNPVEMAMASEKDVIDRLSKIEEYIKLFAQAFPEEKNAISYDNLKKAIGAYERKLITPSKFDKYIAGDNKALNTDEKKGLQTYINSGCITCHSGALLGGNMYQKFGLFDDYWKYTKSENIDNGRFDVTGNEADKYFFKVPSLRNIEKTYPYFHDGSVATLEESIKIMAKTQVNKDLSDTEISEIVTFLKTLTADISDEYK